MKQRRFATILRSAAVAFSVLLGAVSQLAGAQEGEAGQGAAIYTERCAACHENAKGRTPSRAYLVPRLPSEIIYALTRGPMRQQAGGLSADQIGALATYLTGRPRDSLPDPKANLCRAPEKPAAVAGQWPIWGGNEANTRFQPAPGFQAADLPRLKVKWAFALPGLTGGPVIAGDTLFVVSRLGQVVALDSATGCTRWFFETEAPVRSAVAVGAAGGKTAAFLGDQTAEVRAVDAATGKLLWHVRADPYPSAQIVGPVTYYQGRVYVPLTANDESDALDPAFPCCKFRGGVVALDASDGRIVWRGYSIAEEPKPTRVNSAGTQMYGPSGGGVWSAPTVDPKRRLVYAATGNGYSAPAADGTDAVVAFDIDTGRRVWATQGTPDDIWLYRCDGKAAGNCPDPMGVDFDFTAPPMLQTGSDGRQVLVAGSKAGIVWAFDPDSKGKLLWRTRVGKGGPGDAMWGLTAQYDTVFASNSSAGEANPDASGGLFALTLRAGKTAWRVPVSTASCAWGAVGCEHRAPAAVTAIPGAVLSGSLDGHLRAYASADGKLLWDMDTAQAYDAVNGAKAYGGNLDGAPDAVANGTLFVNSGNATATSPRRGDAVLAISVDGR
jgi:polyvinyl alcohol dehydrogenase (cytochrome)